MESDYDATRPWKHEVDSYDAARTSGENPRMEARTILR